MLEPSEFKGCVQPKIGDVRKLLKAILKLHKANGASKRSTLELTDRHIFGNLVGLDRDNTSLLILTHSPVYVAVPCHICMTMKRHTKCRGKREKEAHIICLKIMITSISEKQ
jgi:hypothetical protein